MSKHVSLVLYSWFNYWYTIVVAMFAESSNTSVPRESTYC